MPLPFDRNAIAQRLIDMNTSMAEQQQQKQNAQTAALNTFKSGQIDRMPWLTPKPNEVASPTSGFQRWNATSPPPSFAPDVSNRYMNFTPPQAQTPPALGSPYAQTLGYKGDLPGSAPSGMPPQAPVPTQFTPPLAQAPVSTPATTPYTQRPGGMSNSAPSGYNNSTAAILGQAGIHSPAPGGGMGSIAAPPALTGAFPPPAGGGQIPSSTNAFPPPAAGGQTPVGSKGASGTPPMVRGGMM